MQVKQSILNLNIDKAKSRDTGMAMVLICLILYLWFKNDTFIKVGTAVLILTMTAPILFKPLGYLWFGLAHIMGTIVSKILLFLVFVLLVTPVGIFRKVLGKDSMKLKKWKTGPESVFETRNHVFTAEDITKPY